MFALSVMFEIFPEHREAFINAALQQAKNSLAGEQDCLIFEVYNSENDPNRFYFHEVYKNKAAFENVHTKTPYFAAYKKTTESYIKAATREFWNSL